MTEHKPAGFPSRALAALIDTLLYVVIAGLFFLFLGLNKDLDLIPQLFQSDNLEQLLEEQWINELDDFGAEIESLKLDEIPASSQRRMAEIFQEEFDGFGPELIPFGPNTKVDLEDLTTIFPGTMDEVNQRVQRSLDRIEAEDIEGVTPEKTQFFRAVAVNALSPQKLIDLMFEFLWRIAPALLLLLYIYAGYHGIEVLFAASPGKMVLGMRIADSEGDKSNLFQNLIRNVIKLFPAGFLIAALVLQNAFLLIGFPVTWLIFSIIGNALLLGPRHRSLVDRLSGSAVYFRRKMNDH
jgi:uncharacterized RDD family membrane protein YckC